MSWYYNNDPTPVKECTISFNREIRNLNFYAAGPYYSSNPDPFKVKDLKYTELSNDFKCTDDNCIECTGCASSKCFCDLCTKCKVGYKLDGTSCVKCS